MVGAHPDSAATDRQSPEVRRVGRASREREREHPGVSAGTSGPDAGGDPAAPTQQREKQSPGEHRHAQLRDLGTVAVTPRRWLDRRTSCADPVCNGRAGVDHRGTRGADHRSTGRPGRAHHRCLRGTRVVHGSVTAEPVHQEQPAEHREQQRHRPPPASSYGPRAHLPDPTHPPNRAFLRAEPCVLAATTHGWTRNNGRFGARTRTWAGKRSGDDGGDGLGGVGGEVERGRGAAAGDQLGAEGGHHRAVVGAQARARHPDPDADRGGPLGRPSRGAGSSRRRRRR